MFILTRSANYNVVSHPFLRLKGRKYCIEELGTEYYAINSDSKQTRVELVASENGLTDRACTGFNHDAINSEWNWSDGSLSL